MAIQRVLLVFGGYPSTRTVHQTLSMPPLALTALRLHEPDPCPLPTPSPAMEAEAQPLIKQLGLQADALDRWG